MRRLAPLLLRLLRHQGGATAMEYGLLLALLSVVVITAVTTAGNGLFTSMSTLSNRINGR